MTEQFERLLAEACAEIPLELSAHQTEQFFQYYELLNQWNQVMNLTAITEIHEVVTKHFADSLLLFPAIPEIKKERWRVIDVGTGAGFPGIPLKLAFPHLEIVLLDSLQKRVDFLNEVIHTLQLSGISAVHGRAEDFGRNAAYREQFDLCVSRAVANLSILSEYCIPFVKVGGQFVSYKSGKAGEEMEQARRAVFLLGGEFGPVCERRLPGTDAQRLFVPIRKLTKTSKKYPRKAGMPTKMPLSGAQ